jgi:hypothetical protein
LIVVLVGSCGDCHKFIVGQLSDRLVAHIHFDHLAGLSPTTIEDRNRGTRIDKTLRQ